MNDLHVGKYGTLPNLKVLPNIEGMLAGKRHVCVCECVCTAFRQQMS